MQGASLWAAFTSSKVSSISYFRFCVIVFIQPSLSRHIIKTLCCTLSPSNPVTGRSFSLAWRNLIQNDAEHPLKRLLALIIPSIYTVLCLPILSHKLGYQSVSMAFMVPGLFPVSTPPLSLSWRCLLPHIYSGDTSTHLGLKKKRKKRKSSCFLLLNFSCSLGILFKHLQKKHLALENFPKTFCCLDVCK